MKLRSLIYIQMLLLAAPVSYGQALDTLWTSFFVSSGNTTVLGAAALPDGGFVVVGFSRVNYTHEDFFAARLNEDGHTQWIRNYDTGPGLDMLESVVSLENGSFVAVGSTADETTTVIMGIAENGDSLWSHTYVLDKGLCSARRVIRLADGNLGVIGYSIGADNQHSDIWLLKCTVNGDSIWTHSYGGSDTDTGVCLLELPNGDLQLAGNYASTGSTGDSDFWTQRVSSTGEPIGAHQLHGFVNADRVQDLTLNSIGDMYICGSTRTGGGHRGYVVKEAAVGESWEQTYFANGAEEQFYGIVPRLNGALCAGLSGSFFGQTRPLLVSINSSGGTEWAWSYGVDDPGSGFFGIIRVPSGGALAYGTYFQQSTRYGFLLRIAPPGGVAGVVRDVISGEPISDARISASGVDGYAVSDVNGVYSLELQPGTYDLIVYGFCVDSSIVTDVNVIEREMTQFDLTAGAPRTVSPATSVNMFGRDGLNAIGYYNLINDGSGMLYFGASAVALSPPGDWITVQPVSGTVAPGNSVRLQIEVFADPGQSGLWDYNGLLHVSTNTCPDTARDVPVMIAVLDADGRQYSQVERFALHPAYPNPFNAETSMQFDLPEPADVRFDLFNLQGQLVKALLSGRVEAGTHSVSLSLPDHPSGVYIARLQAGSFTATRKIVLIK
jgi:hypothetical protein